MQMEICRCFNVVKFQNLESGTSERNLRAEPQNCTLNVEPSKQYEQSRTFKPVPPKRYPLSGILQCNTIKPVPPKRYPLSVRNRNPPSHTLIVAHLLERFTMRTSRHSFDFICDSPKFTFHCGRTFFSSISGYLAGLINIVYLTCSSSHTSIETLRVNTRVIPVDYHQSAQHWSNITSWITLVEYNQSDITSRLPSVEYNHLTIPSRHLSFSSIIS